MVPVLESERLILRGWKREDFPAYAAFCADPERTRHIGGPKSAFEAWTQFAAMPGAWAAEELRLPPLMSFVHPDNLALQAVARRLGAEPMPPTELRGEPRLRFRHSVPA